MMTWSQTGFQDAASCSMEELLYFHDFTLIVLSFIVFFVMIILFSIFFNFWIDLSLMESQTIECVWTLIPTIILTQLAVPSLALLYQTDESSEGGVSLKVTGHQWYWSYEYPSMEKEGENLEFDSFLLSPDISDENNYIRLLDVDNRLVLPFGIPTQAYITSADVLHSWAIPSLAVKLDACPGRLNLFKVYSHFPGSVFGQCSEICGANHSFMPIAVEFVSIKDFLNWLN